MMTMLQELLENTELQNLPEEVQHKLERALSDQQSLINNLESRNVQLRADLAKTQNQLTEKEAIRELSHIQSSVLEEKLVEDEEVLQSQDNWLNNELQSKIEELLELEREKGNEILELKENLAYKEDKNENRKHEKEIEAKMLQEHLHSELSECQESLQFRDGIEEQTGMELPEKEEYITLLTHEQKTLGPIEVTNGPVTDTNKRQTSAAVDEQKEEMEVFKNPQEPMDFSNDKDDKQREDRQEKKETQDSAPHLEV